MDLPFLHERLVIVDLETTGTAATGDAITEIGMVRVECGEVVEEWSSLVNPGTRIPPDIQTLTGITDAMVRDAPTFAALADEVLRRLDGSLFVAHNARFDYGFLKNAFRRLGRSFTAEVLCTVRLSRRLYPGYASHSLDALVARHQLRAAGRHRALGDARLAWQFMQRVVATFPAEDIAQATKSLLKMPSLPPQLEVGALDGLPEGPGVYLFYGINDLPIYIGKSVNLRDRVRSHFSSDHRQSNDVRLSLEIRRIGFEETAGEFGALLRESQLIKSVKPLRNLRLRRNAQMVFISLAEMDRAAQLIAINDADLDASSSLYGPFASKPRAKALLTNIATDFRLCWKAIGAQTTDGPCFAHQLKRCNGFCVGSETLRQHNTRLAEALAEYAFPPWPYAGPIGIIETHPAERWQSGHVFDRWRYLGAAKTDEDMLTLAQQRTEIEFDADIFKVLRKCLRSGEHRVIALGARAA